MTVRLGMIQINVTDLQQAWAFYVDTLGITGRWLLGENKAFELDLSTPGARVLVYPVDKSVERNYGHETGVTLVLHTDNVEDTVSKWRARGVEFVPIAWSTRSDGIADTPFGPFIAFVDPFKNVHELIELRA